MPPRWQFSRPSHSVLADLREELVHAPLSYTEAELSILAAVRDEESIGPAAALARAAERLLNFEHLSVPSMEVCPTTAQAGAVVTFGVASGPMWGLCACRVVDIVHQPDRVALTYGTLPVHAIVGQETFELRVQTANVTSWYTGGKSWLQRTDAHVVCIQEHHLVTDEEILNFNLIFIPLNALFPRLAVKGASL